MFRNMMEISSSCGFIRMGLWAMVDGMSTVWRGHSG